jgi:hypothetical protein
MRNKGAMKMSVFPRVRREMGRESDTTRLRARLMLETGASEAEVGFAVGLALERFRGARIREFVTLLAERDARRRLHEMRLNPGDVDRVRSSRPPPDE